MPRPVALITGPTSGIGAGFARRYARDGYDLVLVARDVAAPRSNWRTNCATEPAATSRFCPPTWPIAADRDKVADRLAAGVRVLVNNAGFGTSGEFWTADSAAAAGPARRQRDRGDAADPGRAAGHAGRRRGHRHQRRQRRRAGAGARVDLLGIQGLGDLVHRGPGRRAERAPASACTRCARVSCTPNSTPGPGSTWPRHAVVHVARGRRRGQREPGRCRRAARWSAFRACSTRRWSPRGG